MDYCNGDETSPSQRSYSVLRSKFDAWLMEQAEEAGAQLDSIVAEAAAAGVKAKSTVVKSDLIAESIIAAAKAWAFLQQRQFVIPEDVQAVFPAVANHRLHSLQSNVSVDQLLQKIIKHVVVA